tara:strand:- start:8691 stop:9737 length:1047 start_codon:yes stop_codon:yes gene_type:complete
MKRNYLIKDCSIFSIKTRENIKSAIEKINKGGIQICLVLSDKNKFEGIITDSDLRKGILNGISQYSSVKDVMNTNPVTINEFFSEEKIFTIMLKHHIFHIPVIDENKKLKGIFVSENLTEEKILNETFFILAGGKGLRMRPLTEKIPKPMLSISGKPMLEIIINNAINYGFRNFVISIGYLGEVIKDYFGNGAKLGINISYIEEDKPLGTAGSLSLLESSSLTDYLFVINGDVITSLEYSNMLDFAKVEDCDGVMGVKNYEMRNPFGEVRSDNGNLIAISEKPIYQSTINAGVYIISKKLISLLEKDTYMDMTDLFKIGIKRNKVIKVFAIHEEWSDLGRPEDYKKLV